MRQLTIMLKNYGFSKGAADRFSPPQWPVWRGGARRQSQTRRARGEASRPIRMSFGAVLFCAVISSGIMTAQPAKARDIVAYKVRPGDTLYQLAEDYLLSPGHAEKVRRINRIKNPRRLPIGKVIYIPKPYLRFTELTAKVQAYRGTVTMSRKGRAGISQVSKGMTLKEGDIVSTAVAGFVTLAIEGGARTSLPSRSTVRIDRLRRYRINDEVERIFSLHKGRTEVEAGGASKDKGGRTLEIRGPNATAAIRGTGFSISALPESTGISVLHGTVAAAASADAAPLYDDAGVDNPISGADQADLGLEAPGLAVDAGLGVLGDDAGLSDTIKLLEAPEQAEPRTLFMEPEVDFALVPLSGAKAYRFRIATDAAMIDAVAEKDSSSPEASFDYLEDGRYFMQVSAIDKYGLEGKNRTYSFRRVLASVDAAEAKASGDQVKFAWTATGKGGPVRFVLADNQALTNPMIDRAGLAGSELTLSALPPGTYYWAVERRLVLDGEPVVVTSGPRELVMTGS